MKNSLAIDTAPLKPSELDVLRRMRLENRWSFRRMADAIGLTESTLRNVLESDQTPRDVTVYAIRQWMKSVAA